MRRLIRLSEERESEREREREREMSERESHVLEATPSWDNRVNIKNQ